MAFERERYEREVGEPKELPEDHPDRWQWLYRGTKDEREQLLDRLSGESESVEQDPLFE